MQAFNERNEVPNAMMIINYEDTGVIKSNTQLHGTKSILYCYRGI